MTLLFSWWSLLGLGRSIYPNIHDGKASLAASSRENVNSLSSSLIKTKYRSSWISARDQRDKRSEPKQQVDLLNCIRTWIKPWSNPKKDQIGSWCNCSESWSLNLSIAKSCSALLLLKVQSMYKKTRTEEWQSQATSNLQIPFKNSKLLLSEKFQPDIYIVHNCCSNLLLLYNNKKLKLELSFPK